MTVEGINSRHVHSKDKLHAVVMEFLISEILPVNSTFLDIRLQNVLVEKLECLRTFYDFYLLLLWLLWLLLIIIIIIIIATCTLLNFLKKRICGEKELGKAHEQLN